VKKFNNSNEVKRQMNRDIRSWTEEVAGRISRKLINNLSDEGLSSPSSVKQSSDGSVSINYKKDGTAEEIKKYQRSFESAREKLMDNMDNTVGGA
jgi:hypothetical protein